MVFLIVNFLSFIAIVMIYLAIIFFDYKASSEQLVNIKLINFTAFLVSIYLILELLFDTIPILEMQKLFKIKINKFILVLIGIFCGGIHGFFSGLTVDLLGILLIKKITFINLFFTLGSIVSATLPYYLTCIFRKILVSDKIKYYHCAIISFTLTYFLISFSNPIVLKYCFFPRNP